MSKSNGNVIITISRAFGSGGREIGKKVAEELGIPFYDKELLEVAADEGKYNITVLDEFDEKNPGVFLYSMAVNPYSRATIVPLDIMVQDILTQTIKNIADQGSCVILGRHADKILRDEYDTLSVFVSAPLEKRIARVVARDGLSEKESKKKIIKADKSRRAFYNSYGEGEWGEASNYNLCIDSGDLGIDDSAAMILRYLKLKGKLV